MKLVTGIAATFLLLGISEVEAQKVEFSLDLPASPTFENPYTPGAQSGSRGISGPFDSDGDGNLEILVTDYSGGGRVHVVESRGPDTWELAWSVPFNDSTGQSNARYAVGDADLDNDGNKEIVFFNGAGFSATNPNVVNGTFRPGLWIYEHTGQDDDYGTLPAFICEFDQATGFFIAEQLAVEDVDGDGIDEILAPQNNSGSAADLFYIYSVVGTFEPNGAANSLAVCADEFTMARGQTAVDNNYFDFNQVGGGSPYAMHPADLDGDGTKEISIHAWNSFNFFNVDVTGANAYTPPDPLSASPNLAASAPNDHVSLFAGTVIDIDQNGDDEVFYPRFQSGLSGLVSILNYEPGEDASQVTAENLRFDLLGPLTQFGITAGDMTKDGKPDLIGAGFSYSASQYNSGIASSWIRIAAYLGGDPEDPASYDIREFDTSSPVDTSHFDVVINDSAGVITRSFETALGKFASKLAYLGDADGDGEVEVAVGFQSVPDSIDIFDRFFQPDSVTGVFNTPVGAGSAGPIDSGQAYEFSIDAAPETKLFFVSMFIPSNDLFFAPADSGIALFNPDGSQRSGDVTAEVQLWDAGTEMNEAPGLGANQPANQAGPNTGPADPIDTVRVVNDGFTYPAVADVVQVTLTPGGGGQFVVRIENVSTATTLNGNMSVPMSPGVWVVTTESLPLEGEPASSELESLAEDGDPGALAATSAADFGFFRVLRERVAAPNREFLRILATDGLFVGVEETAFILPSDYKLHPNYPNPFNPTTTFSFELPIDKVISVNIYDVTGRLVNSLVNRQPYAKGTHQITWDGTSQGGDAVASGNYFYSLEYGSFRQTRPMVLVK